MSFGLKIKTTKGLFETWDVVSARLVAQHYTTGGYGTIHVPEFSVHLGEFYPLPITENHYSPLFAWDEDTKMFRWFKRTSSLPDHHMAQFVVNFFHEA